MEQQTPTVGVLLGELFAQCLLDGYPSAAMEQVLDSSRYFVIRIQDDQGQFVLVNRQTCQVPVFKCCNKWKIKVCHICYAYYARQL